MIERMMEAERKEYWQTDAETLKTLTETYLDIAREHDVFSDNDKFNEYLETQAAGFGLDISQVPAIDPQLNAAAQSQPVSGQELKQVEQTEVDGTIFWERMMMLSLLFITVLLGAFWQGISARRLTAMPA